jgi:hypothetical protein
MKSALFGAAALAAAAFATPVLAQAVVEQPSYCTQFDSNGSCRDQYRDWQNQSVLASHQVEDNNAYRYHGGPKYND